MLGAAPLAVGAGLTPSLAPAPAAAAEGLGSPPALRPGGKFHRFVARRAAEDAFSGTVLLAHAGRPVLSLAYGMANKKRSLPNQMGTLFNLASVTKCFTGLAVARLAHQGKVAFHQTLGTYLDGFPAEIADRVTVHQLLTHTSGMGDYSEAKEFQEGLKKWRSADEMMDGVMAIIRRSDLRFTPGIRHAYSNSGFFVLGALVAQVSRLSYFDYVRRYVFAPAGMSRSDFYTKPQVLAAEDIAHRYPISRTGERIDFTESEYFGFIGGPADGAYSSTLDLLNFAKALRSGAVLNHAFTELVTSAKVPLTPSDGPPDPSPYRSYGYGFRSVIVNDKQVLGHSGGTVGGATNIDIFPEQNWVAIVLGNYSDPITPIVQLARDLITRSRT
ncbi:serine hydrolase domain-containing protein [Actinomadura terrae]|uniref:serine hydrolase domain-containing protein n=1 Tax=Actinomadura terrae TaxID=604353 RepID=UPI001FA7FACF|nr:serine hydrolase domain-containing protein [Actinomadura terrae]